MFRFLNSIGFWLYLLFCGILMWSTSTHIFFWDTVQLASKHAHWYFETNFATFLLPDEIDSGHPPFFGMYLAGVWAILGKTLWASHLAMLPFILLLGWAIFRLGSLLGAAPISWMLFALFLVDPVLAGQYVLVSPDLVLVVFFLLGLIGVMEDRVWLKMVAAIVLAMISTRGMMTVMGLYLFEVLGGPQGFLFRPWAAKHIESAIQKALPYVPSGLVALAFLGIHYAEKGWIGYHSDSPWAPSFARVGFNGFIKNVALLGWRMLDFGRIFLFLVLAFIGIRNWRWVQKDQWVRSFFILILVFIPALCTTFLLYQYLQSHRYLLPLMLSFTLLFYRLLFLLQSSLRYWLFGVVFIGFLWGNRWVYPESLAQGWDASLAHWPYYQLREKAFKYLEDQRIPIEQVGTAFPEIGPVKFRDLSGQQKGLKEKELESDPYILYSNVMNDFSDEERKKLTDQWNIIEQWEQGGIKMVLYGKPAEK